MQVSSRRRVGWHTDELVPRARRARAQRPGAAATERLVAHLGSCAGPRARGPVERDATGLLDADAVLARIIPTGSLEQIIFRVDALHWLEERGVPGDELAARHRALRRQVLHDGAAAGGRACRCRRPSSASGRTTRWPPSWRWATSIVKPIFGSMGHGMVRVSDPDVALPRGPSARADAGRVLRAARRRSRRPRRPRVRRRRRASSAPSSGSAPDGEWRTNVSRGGTARPIDLPPEWQQLAMRRGGGGRRRLRGRRSAARARRLGLRARGQRHSRLAGPAAGHRARRRRRHRRSSGRSRARGAAPFARTELPV